MISLTDVQTTLAPLVRTAWAENPSLAIHLVTRFPYPRILKEVRWLLLNFPAKAVAEPEALPILYDGSLPEDVSFQLKVRRADISLSCLIARLLTDAVSPVLGTCQPHHGCDFVSSAVSEQSFLASVCCKGSREPLCRCHLLLCSSDSADAPIRCSRLCRTVHYRDCTVLSALCSPDHMEYESKCLQG